MESHKYIVILPIILALTAAIVKTESGNNGTRTNVQTTAPLFNPNVSANGAISSEDETNGDDGGAIKKDLEEISKKLDNNLTTSDNHQFYKPEYITEPERAMSFWFDFSELKTINSSTKHEMLSKSYRRAAPFRLSFDFPFYGQPLRNIIVATGGFLYVGEHIHHWLAATQNISPLMANFDLSTSPLSDIYHYDNGSSFVVQWNEVQMKDNKPPGNFSFQVTLHKNGDIIFVYKSLPVKISQIPDTDHPVKVGISDAFLIDRVAFFLRRKTIYDYHRLNLKEVPEIKNKTAIFLKALPTCNQFDICETCAKAPVAMECVWCPAVTRCSNGYDRRRQDWLSNHCDKITKSDCSKKEAEPQGPFSAGNQIFSVDTNMNKILLPDKPEKLDKPDSRGVEGGAAFLTFLMFMGLISGIALWTFYAYRNPHTPSGQLLIKYRPGNWRWQNAETRYTAASIHM